MDLADIKRKAQAAREFSHQIDHATFTLRLPTAHEAECAAVRSQFVGVSGASEAVLRYQRALLELAVVGWSGVTVGDILPGHEQAADEFAFEPGAAPVLLDARPEWANRLWPPLLERQEQRNAQQAAAAKN